MAKAVKSYTVRYERDDTGWWVATVKGVKGCHTQGRTIEEARRRIREALGLFVKNADGARLEDEVRLPSKVRAALGRYRTLRTRLERDQEAAAAATRDAVAVLRKDFGLSVRDAADLLGLSFQRVHQIDDAA